MATSRSSRSLSTTIAANIKAARAVSGLSQRDLGDRMGIDWMAISRWERGQHRPSDQNLLVLAHALGREPGWFYIEHDSSDDPVNDDKTAAA